MWRQKKKSQIKWDTEYPFNELHIILYDVGPAEALP